MNPRGYPYPVSLRTWLADNQINLLLAGAPAAPPIIPKDAPNPRGASFPVSLRTFTDGGWVGRFGVAPQAPFATWDFSNPRAAAHPVDLRTWIDRSTALLATVLQRPPPFDFANPGGYPFPTDLRGFLAPPNLLLLTLAQTPFANYDFPNPRSSPSYLSALRTGIDQGFSVLLGAPSGSDDGWLPYYVRRRHRGR